MGDPRPARYLAITSSPTTRLTSYSGEDWLDVRPGRAVFQSKTEEDGTEYLLRVFVDVDRIPAEVVTAYRTSKVAKYWRDE